MKHILVLSLILSVWLQAAITLKPVHQIVVDGSAKDIVLDGEWLYIGTDTGKMQRYNIHSKQFGAEVNSPILRISWEMQSTRESQALILGMADLSC